MNYIYEIKGLFNTIDRNKNIQLGIEINNKMLGEKSMNYLDLSEVDPKNPKAFIRLLCNKGGYVLNLDFETETIKRLLYKDLKMMPSAPQIKYESIGWQKFKGEAIYKLYGFIVTKEGKKDAVYDGNRLHEYRCDRKVFQNMLSQDIYNRAKWSPLEFIIAYSTAAILKGYLVLMGVANLDNITVYLSGPSSTGKTTSIDLATSFFGNPYDKGGFKLPLDSSSTALWDNAQNSFGCVLGYDELSRTDKKVGELIKNLSNGIAKGRAKSNGKLDETTLFDVLMIMTGNRSISNQIHKDTALKTRVIEIGFTEMTESPEQAERIQQAIRHSNGWMAIEIAECLLKHSEKYIQAYNEHLAVDRKRVIEDGITFDGCDRLMKMVALIQTAAELFNETFDGELDVDGIFEFTYLHFIICNARDNSIAPWFINILTNNISNFEEDYLCDLNVNDGSFAEDMDKLPADKWGYLECVRQNSRKDRDGNLYNTVFLISDAKFDEICINNGLDPMIVLDGLGKSKMLRCKQQSRAESGRGHARGKFYDSKKHNSHMDWIAIYFFSKKTEYLYGNILDVRSNDKEEDDNDVAG